MKIDDPTVFDPADQKPKAPFWVTLGGKIEEGEEAISAARRELFEETGFKDAEIGSAVWYGEHVLQWKGTPTLFKETFFVARIKKGEATDEKWTADERQVIVATKWWRLEELLSTHERILPAALIHLISPLAHGIYPEKILTIDLSG